MDLPNELLMALPLLFIGLVFLLRLQTLTLMSRKQCKMSQFTCVLRHGGLICVSFFFKDNIAKLQHCGDHLQHAWQRQDKIKVYFSPEAIK